MLIIKKEKKLEEKKLFARLGGKTVLLFWEMPFPLASP